MKFILLCAGRNLRILTTQNGSIVDQVPEAHSIPNEVMQAEPLKAALIAWRPRGERCRGEVVRALLLRNRKPIRFSITVGESQAPPTASTRWTPPNSITLKLRKKSPTKKLQRSKLPKSEDSQRTRKTSRNQKRKHPLKMARQIQTFILVHKAPLMAGIHLPHPQGPHPHYA